MDGKFIILKNGEQETYTNSDNIPDDFDHLIEFSPDSLEPEGEDGNHTDEQHAEMVAWNDKLQQLKLKEIENAQSRSL